MRIRKIEHTGLGECRSGANSAGGRISIDIVIPPNQKEAASTANGGAVDGRKAYPQY